jgi:hypothetical protein
MKLVFDKNSIKIFLDKDTLYWEDSLQSEVYAVLTPFYTPEEETFRTFDIKPLRSFNENFSDENEIE